MIAGLVDQPPCNAEIDELTVRVDACAPSNLEFGFGERRSAFVFRNDSFTMGFMRPRRVLGYARVSSKLQGLGSSLQDQQDTLSAYAKDKHLPKPVFFVESETAIHEKNEKRDRIRALMSEVRRGDLVLCDKVDRWSRDPEFTYRSVRQIMEAGASVYFVGEQCDPSTPEGDTMLNFRIVFAKEEHKRIKQRMVGTRKILRDQGYYVEGLAPFGYRRPFPKGYKGVEKNILAIEPEEAKLMRKAFRLCVSGHSMTNIGNILGITRDRVFDGLKNRVYLGEIENTSGTWIKGKHAALIDADTFALAQAALSARRLGSAKPRDAKSETSDWILRDVALCGLCGARMSAAYAGPHEKRRYYFKCSHGCTKAYIPVRGVESEASPLIVARLEELKEELAREPKRIAPAPAPDFAGRRATLERRRNKYLELCTDGLMTKDELRGRLIKLDADALRVDAEEQAALRPSPLADASARRSVLREVGVIAKAWARARPEARREIVGHLAVAARLSSGKRPRFVWRPAEELLVEVT